MAAWNATRTKAGKEPLLAIQRLRTLQEKKENLAKASRRDIATLIERNKLETARIKVESIINDDIHLELLEVLELYSEILLTRYALLEKSSAREPDPHISEAIISIVYAAHHTEIKELHYVREALMSRFGRDWSIGVMENKEACVTPRITGKLLNETPSPLLVDAYLGEIAKGYRIPWKYAEPKDDAPLGADVPSAVNVTDVLGEVDVTGTDQNAVTHAKGGDKIDDTGPGLAPPPANVKSSHEDDTSTTSLKAPGDKGDKGKSRSPPRSILRTSSSSSTTKPPVDRPPQVRATSPSLPREPPPSYMSSKPITPATADDDEDEDEELLRRFAALKKKGP